MKLDLVTIVTAIPPPPLADNGILPDINKILPNKYKLDDVTCQISKP